MDQSFLRLTKTYHEDPSEIVVLAATTVTLARSVSVYRHYLERGNVLAVKPRFKSLPGGNGLELINYPLQEKGDLARLRLYKSFFRENDEHFPHWKKERRHRIRNQILTSLTGLEDSSRSKKSEDDYALSFWKSELNLFLGILQLFSELSQKHGFRPFFLLQHQPKSLENALNLPAGSTPWHFALESAARRFPEITFIDEADALRDEEDHGKLYCGSHHTKFANQLVANYINNFL